MADRFREDPDRTLRHLEDSRYWEGRHDDRLDREARFDPRHWSSVPLCATCGRPLVARPTCAACGDPEEMAA